VGSEFEIRSFRSVFSLERRIYRLDTLRLHPAGVPLRGIGYAAVFVAAALVAGSVPPTSWLDGLAPWYLRDIGIPLAVAVPLGSLRIDGRPFHHAMRAVIAYALSPHRLRGLADTRPRAGRWRPPAIVCVPDGSDGRFRALRYRGPGAVLVRRPHLRAECATRRRVMITLHPLDGQRSRATVLELGPGAVVEVRPR